MAPLLTKEKSVTVEKKMMATLWILCNLDTYRSSADRFDLSKGTLHLIVMSVCNVITSIVDTYITFPSTLNEYERLASGFQQRCGFPGVIGAVDGTHIDIPAPQNDHRSSYINRKGTPSMVLQVISGDSSLKFLDIYTGWPGSVHDARVFKNSPVAQKIASLPHKYHVLGDSAYPLMENVMVPFRDNGHLSVTQKKYNKCHSSTRMEVERAIGLLKCRFRRLKKLEMQLQTEIPVVISSCCVLHNFILMNDGDDLDFDVTFDDNCGQIGDADTPTVGASNKRVDIANLLML